MTVWAHRVQDETLATADCYGEPWTPEQVEFVGAFTDDATDQELAEATGRTLYAVWAIQHRIRTTGVDFVANEVRAAIERRRAAEAVEVGYDFVTTFPPGWND